MVLPNESYRGESDNDIEEFQLGKVEREEKAGYERWGKRCQDEQNEVLLGQRVC